MLKVRGIGTAACRQRTGSWSEFLQSHCDSISTADVTTVEDRALNGLVEYSTPSAMRPIRGRVKNARICAKSKCYDVDAGLLVSH